MEIEDVWKQFGHRLHKFVETRVSDSFIADELTQELLIKIYQNLGTLQQHERIEAWLFRVARNVVNDYYRKKATNKEDLLPEIDSLIDSVQEDLPESQAREELSNCIKPFIDELPPKYRDTLTSIDLEGNSQKALADRLGISHSTVKSQTQRGRAQLKKLFKQCCDFEIDARGNVVDYKPKSEQCQCDKDC